jgi:GNAT superfamily N-acetyltransferase
MRSVRRHGKRAADVKVPALEISTDRNRIDVSLVHYWLSQTYWASTRPLDVVQRIVQNSVCFGGYIEGRQVGFGRLVTDSAVFAWAGDMIVAPEERGRGYGRLILAAMLDYADNCGVLSIVLNSRDARGLYEKFGFVPDASVETRMIRRLPEGKRRVV